MAPSRASCCAARGRRMGKRRPAKSHQPARGPAEYYVGFHPLLGEHVTQIVLYVGREPLIE